MSVSILKTKLNIPPQRPGFVMRLRLAARLEEGQHQRYSLILISAKAGSGKTTLVSEWIHQQSIPTAWLSLDANDNEFFRFISYLAAALNELGITINQSVLRQLKTPPFPTPETLISEIINLVSTPVIIVLDDFHIIQNEQIHQAVEFLVEHKPANLHLICITRVNPPLSLPRLRARGRVLEIRDNDLKFTSEEAAQFFNKTMELDLPPEAVSTLEERTEGWIAGLQLAAVSIKGRQGKGDLAAFITTFGGTNRYILDYLIEEVLGQQPLVVQEFLLDTAILDRMCAKLCDTIRDHTEEADRIGGSQKILEQLEQSNLFVLPLDEERRWYRYHHLFSTLLRSTLSQKKTDAQIRDLNRRAGHWHKNQNNMEEAMQHAMAAQEYEQAAQLVEDNLARMFSRSEVPVLLSWIKKIPEEIIKGRPWIDIYRANTLVISGKPDEAVLLLDEVEKRISADTPRYMELSGHIAAIRAYSANLCGDAALAVEMAMLARDRLPEDHITGLGMAAYTLADTYFACDDLKQAGQVLCEMVKTGEKTTELMIIIPALSELALIRRVQGRLQEAEKYLDQVYKLLADSNSLEIRLRCSYEFGIAELLRERNRLDAAYRHALLGDEYRKRHGGYLMVGDLTLMRVHQARGDAQRALESLHTAERVMEAHQLQLAVCTEFKTARVLQLLAVGDLEKAAQRAADCSGGTEREMLALARLWLAQGRADKAHQTLTQLRKSAEAGSRMGRLIEILCLQALALDELKKSDQAVNIVFRALSLGRPEGFVRTFLDLGERLLKLLERVSAQGSTKEKSSTAHSLTIDYARELIKAFKLETQTIPEQKAQGLVSALTGRELEVLRWLAEGLTNKAIAEKLVVAPSTVKQHLKNIYGKLDAHNRTEAVARGRELELL
ncbi:LuxR C-terminal-related transcriptional regulator [Chloroflexota bacterium]